MAEFNPKAELPTNFEYVDLESVVGTELINHRTQTKCTAPSRAQRLAQYGDLFYQLVRPYQKNNYLFELNSENFVFSTGYAQLRPSVDGYFLMSLVQNEYFVQKVLDNCTGTSYPAINVNDLAEINIYTSLKKSEQARIGTFFRQLDRLVTLHQCNCNMATRPCEWSSGLRAIAWEQRKVGNLIEDYVERTTIQNQYPVLTSSQQQGIVLQEAYFADRQVTTNDNVGYFVLPKGYFTYRSRSDTDVFVFNRNDILDKGIISYYYPVFQTKYTCSDFLLRRLNHGIRKQLAMAAEGTGQKVLAHSKFKNMTVSVPKIGEQQKIGTFFRQLDRLITLHQRKHILLT